MVDLAPGICALPPDRTDTVWITFTAATSCESGLVLIGTDNSGWCSKVEDYARRCGDGEQEYYKRRSAREDHQRNRECVDPECVERGNKKATNSICFVGDSGLPSAYPATDFASAVTATAALAVRELLEKRTGQAQTAMVDHRLTSFWF